MLLADRCGIGPFGMGHGAGHDFPGVPGESFEHHCLPYFLCTACLLTPSSAAISCHDQPCTRALLTCTASSCSSSRLQRGDRPQPHPGVTVTGTRGEIRRFSHDVNVG